ncbi:hypothetical protein HUZ36_13030 [Pseudoalteromonas sp. McH1-7]|uniref:Uncharacterized protein n=1 Tax=Pseudoalteromonas peptidolytica F12-50-A1 TaxID=1315280 RepID=A0A8I0T4I0_9GAMM|nr:MULTISPECIES: hypothetical protein [Pseudoalteromonas]MBE0346995.1 hypothetical protein [Pseudoalteromonas peptidolytica F12-50-A1]NLR14049.1 hypothetical protein [Pseudoalteromonas peptidolytica]NUZ11704.1 hypothetical protein [Pseudoalteromonas sp. McH1-7]RXE94580.1 hypothetical protein D9603_21605 [Pseudoalteromonas sp. PS5]USD29513.1 hypothetical protein J8Z24_05355 [Pseudoalteromonas sp. SCSIO 43201]
MNALVTATVKGVVLATTLLMLSGCKSSAPQMSTMEVRSLQTKEYSDAESILVYRALVNALLDREFTISASDSSSGVLIANYSTTQTNTTEAVTKALATYFTLGLNWIFGDNNMDDILTVDVSANVAPIKSGSRLRINAVAKRLNSDGEIVESQMIVDPNYYQGIFEQIEKSVFLEQNIN